MKNKIPSFTPTFFKYRTQWVRYVRTLRWVDFPLLEILPLAFRAHRLWALIDCLQRNQTFLQNQEHDNNFTLRQTIANLVWLIFCPISLS